MKRISKKKIRKTLEIVFTALFVIATLYIIASYIDVITHNSVGKGYGEYHSWNLFTMF